MVITKSEAFTKKCDMSKIKNSLASLAMDLNRTALGLHRGSNLMAKRFYNEALLRKSEVDLKLVPFYIKKILIRINENNNLDNRSAEDILVDSILLENFVLKKLS